MASATRKKRSKNLSPNNSLKSSSSLFPEPSPDFLPSSKRDLLRLLAVVCIATSVAVFCNFLVNFYNQQPKPFCDSGIDVEDFFDDNCEPCPNNGICSEGKLECARGYVKQGRLCIEDRDINAAARTLSKLIEFRVCQAYAQYLCSGTGAPWVSKDELWTYLDKHKVMEYHGLDENAYMHAKLRAVEASRELLETRVNSGRFEEFKCPESLVNHYKPTSCCIRQWIMKHALVLVPICALLLGCILMLLKVRRRHNLSVRAEELYNQICDILEENALSSRSLNGEGEPWIVASWLRDYVLTPKERKDPTLWKKVEEFVEEDSRLDRYPKMVKGEAKVVWEWQVEGSLSSSSKRKKAEVAKCKSGGIRNSTANQQLWQPKAVVVWLMWCISTGLLSLGGFSGEPCPQPHLWTRFSRQQHLAPVS